MQRHVEVPGTSCATAACCPPVAIEAMPALTKEPLTKLHAPILYIMRGPSDIAQWTTSPG